MEDRPELEAIFNFYGGDYGSYFITSFLSHGIDDTYLLDAETGTMNFDSSDFRKALELAGKYCVREEGVSPGSPLVVRRTAAEEEKEAAMAFIRLCLSYEGQLRASKDLNFGLSARRDVLEEQIAAMAEDTAVDTLGFGQIVLGDDLDIELDRKALLDMVDKARPSRYFPMELMNIMWEELEQYFSGTITEEMAIDHLESRVELYLEEGGSP